MYPTPLAGSVPGSIIVVVKDGINVDEFESMAFAIPHVKDCGSITGFGAITGFMAKVTCDVGSEQQVINEFIKAGYNAEQEMSAVLQGPGGEEPPM